MPDREQMTPEEEYETKRLKDILWLEDRIAALERENTDLRDELRLLRLATGSRADRAALRRQALAGVPDAPDAQEPLPTTYPADASDFPDWQEREVRRIVAQRCAPLVEALEQCCRVSDHAGRIARKALAAHRAQEKAGGAEADRGE
jgi:hypothetical protein